MAPKLRILAALSVAALLAPLGGCDNAPHAVEGTVTLDGKPLDEAIVWFVPHEPDRKKTGGEVKQGAYRLPAEIGLTPGAYRVEFIDNPPPEDPVERLPDAPRRRNLPGYYSTNSPLTVQMPATSSGEPERFNFDLKTNGR